MTHSSYPTAKNPFDDWPSSKGSHGYRRRGIGEFDSWREKNEKTIVDELLRLDEIREECLRIEKQAFKSDELYPFWNHISTIIWSDIQKWADYNDEEVEMKPEKLYRCPTCGDIITEQALERSMESGGIGMCYCEFSAIDEDGDVWYPRIYNEYDVYHLSPTKAKQPPNIEELGLSEDDVEEFGKAFLKNVNELAEIDES